MKVRVDDLGHETQFHVIPSLITPYNLARFEAKATEFALGYTRYYGLGGWKGTEETVLIYRVASLSNEQRRELIEYLLGFSGMKDVYVVLPGGLAQGYSWDFDSEAFPFPEDHGNLAPSRDLVPCGPAGWEGDEQH